MYIHLNLQREAQNKAKSNPVKFVEIFKGGEILQMFNRISSSFHAKKEKENKPSLTHKRGQTMRELPS